VAVTVDIVVLTIQDGELQVLLVQRGAEPFEGDWALPGGFIRPDESLDAAANRELREETAVRVAHLEQLGAYGDPDRDPRMRVVTVAYLAVLPALGPIAAGTDARNAALVPAARALGRSTKYRLAFDHKVILSDGVERARSKLEYTSIATAFVGKEFTLSDLRTVYEITWGETLDPGNFRRKVLSTPGFVTATGRRATPGPEGGKPPETYRAGALARLDPPMHRPGGNGLA
jgi:8-oxo-dGTP diphosphatase